MELCEHSYKPTQHSCKDKNENNSKAFVYLNLLNVFALLKYFETPFHRVNKVE